MTQIHEDEELHNGVPRAKGNLFIVIAYIVGIMKMNKHCNGFPREKGNVR